VLVSATLQEKLATLVDTLLTNPVPVGLQLQRDQAAGSLKLQEVGDSLSERYQLPPGLQQLYMDVPVKLRLPALLGAPCM
jgi:hypothetical protein